MICVRCFAISDVSPKHPNGNTASAPYLAMSQNSGAVSVPVGSSSSHQSTCIKTPVAFPANKDTGLARYARKRRATVDNGNSETASLLIVICDVANIIKTFLGVWSVKTCTPLNLVEIARCSRNGLFLCSKCLSCKFSGCVNLTQSTHNFG